jgi:hypothetical protein
MTKQTNGGPRRQAPKAPTTQDAVRRVQGSTATKNGGQQSDWTRRLQSTADKQAAGVTSPPRQVGGKRGAPVAGPNGGKAPPATKTP